MFPGESSCNPAAGILTNTKRDSPGRPGFTGALSAGKAGQSELSGCPGTGLQSKWGSQNRPKCPAMIQMPPIPTKA